MTRSIGRAGLMSGVAALAMGLTLIGARAGDAVEAQTPDFDPNRQAFFGDLHIHTKYSFDAFIFNVRATPDDAYRYAKGETIRHAAGFDVRLSGPPLDFIAVTDHAEYMGVLPAMTDPDNPLSQVSYAADLVSSDPEKISAAFQLVGQSLADGVYRPELRHMPTLKSAWQDQIDAAERHNDPGTFTTFIAYEYTSPPDGQNLHRNVIFEGSDAPELPFSALDSQNPEDLWAWLDGLRAEGIEGLAIPHNSNGSDGRMFQRVRFDGSPMDADYAALRMRNEPLIEITQVKGTSETHPMLSPNDEWAGFEIMESYIGSDTPITRFDGGYVRKAIKDGLMFAEREGFNPYQQGFVAASDTHNAGGSFDEDDYFSKIGVPDGTPVDRGSVPPEGETWETYEMAANTQRFSTWGASGLAGVWAEENTREAIYAAFRRKETFATSGPRIRVRFFAGYDIPDDIWSAPDMMAQAYDAAVPMGGELARDGRQSPDFLVWAVRDPRSGWLQRLQVVKGWIEDGEAKEKVFDVACSDGLNPDPDTHRCPDNGATVDTDTCAISRHKGDVELKTTWQDPEFDRRQRAFYYVRVLENPSCRWSTWDALRAGVPPNPALPATIQERAWSSPIWYLPDA